MKLIDAKAALEKIYLAGEAIKEYSGRFYEGKFNGLQCAYEIINDMSTVEERKYGHWITPKAWHVECSECHHVLEFICDVKKYCPNCGAKMEGEKYGIDR